jgi:hypothetical protein
MGLIVVGVLQLAIAAAMMAGWVWILLNSTYPLLSAILSIPLMILVGYIWDRHPSSRY